MENTIRTFVAIDIPNSIREKIAKFQSQLKKYQADVKWVQPEGIHITLKFLGNVEEAKIDSIAQTVQKAIKDIEPFAISIGGAGTFPNNRNPKVLWVGVEEGDEELRNLSLKIGEELTRLGFQKEKRKYSAHLTVGRVRSMNRVNEVINAMHSVRFVGGTFEAVEVNVMKSDLKPTGAEYTALRKTKLQG